LGDAASPNIRISSLIGYTCLMLDIKMYNYYLQQYVSQAIRESDGTNRGIAEALEMIRIGRWFVTHKLERERALAEARDAFGRNRHWPLEIILSQLGVEMPDGVAPVRSPK
jgi:hypothetical protein